MLSFSLKTFFFFVCTFFILPESAQSQMNPLLVLKHPIPQNAGAIHSIKFSQDGTKLITASSIGVRVWNSETGELLLSISDFDNYVQSAAFSWDGKYIVTGDWVRKIKVFDSQSGKLIQEFQDPETNDPTGDFVFGVAFSPNGKWVLSSQRNKTDLWDVATGQMIKRLPDVNNIASWDLFFLPDGQQAVMLSDGGVTLFNVAAGQIVQNFLSGGIAVTPDLKKVITIEGGLKIWDLFTGKALFSSDILFYGKGLAIFPDALGYKLAYTTDVGDIRVDQLAVNSSLSKSSIKTFAKEGDKRFTRVLFSPDGKKIIMNNADTVFVYDSSVLTSAIKGAEGYE